MRRIFSTYVHTPTHKSSVYKIFKANSRARNYFGKPERQIINLFEQRLRLRHVNAISKMFNEVLICWFWAQRIFRYAVAINSQLVHVNCQEFAVNELSICTLRKSRYRRYNQYRNEMLCVFDLKVKWRFTWNLMHRCVFIKSALVFI